MKSSGLAKIFVVTLGITTASWLMALLFSTMAGDTLKSTLRKVQMSRDTSSGREVEEHQTIPAAGLDHIDIDLSSQDVQLQVGDGSDVQIDFKGTGRTGSERILSVLREGSRLTVEARRNFQHGFHLAFLDESGNFEGLNFSSSNLVTVTLPKAYDKALKVHTASGDVTLTGLRLKELEAKTASGNVDVHDCHATDGRIHSSSGDIKLEKQHGRIDAQASSGNISVKSFKGDGLRVQTSSGEIFIIDPETQEIQGGASSGDIHVQLKDGNGWKFRLHARSGEIKNAWAENPDGKKLLELNTNSGDIKVSR